MAMDQQNPDTGLQALRCGFRLGDFRVQPELGELTGPDGVTVRVQPRVVDVLLCLASHAGQVIDRDMLMREVWGQRIVSDDTLTHYLSELRRLFDDDARAPRYLETLPKRGYRLIAPIAVDPPPRAEGTQAGSPGRVRIFAAAAAVLIGLAAIVVVTGLRTDPPAPAQAAIVVLPFSNDTGDTAYEYFVEGLSEEVARTLADGDGLRLVGARSARAVSDRAPAQIADALDVDFIVAGSVSQSTAGLEVNTRLLSAPDGESRWSGRYDASQSQIVRVPGHISDAILSALSLPVAEHMPVATGISALAPEQYDQYLLARHQERKVTPQSLRRALALYRELVEAVPQFALAHAGMANCHALLIQYANVRTGDAAPRVREAAARALALVPELSEAHHALGLLSFYQNDFGAAQVAFQRALAADPDAVASQVMLGRSLMLAGRPAEATTLLGEAVQREPLSPFALVNYAQALTNLARYADAQTYLARAIEVDPQYLNAYWGLAYSLWLQNRPREAARQLEAGVERGILQSEAFAEIGWMHLDAGERSSARRWIDRALEVDPLQPTALHALYFYEWFGDQPLADGALAQLRSVHPTNPNLQGLAALGAAMSGRYEEAVQLYAALDEVERQPLLLNSFYSALGFSHSVALGRSLLQVGETVHGNEVLDTLVDALDRTVYESTPQNLTYLRAQIAWARGDELPTTSAGDSCTKFGVACSATLLWQGGRP